MNHSGKACRRNGFTHDRSSLHCDRWVSTYIGLKKKKKDQITTSTCSVASCGAAQYPHHWSVHWGEIYWIFFYPKPAVAFAGNKVTNSVFLPTVAPHGIRTPFHIDYIWRHSTCMSVKLGHTHTHIHTTFNQISGWPPTSVHVSETLCTLWSLSNPVSVGLTQRWSGPWHPPKHTLSLSVIHCPLSHR